MIRLGAITVKQQVRRGEDFTIRYNVWYITFPFRMLFTNVRREGMTAERNTKRVWFPLGWWYQIHNTSIEEDTHFEIETGYVK